MYVDFIMYTKYIAHNIQGGNTWRKSKTMDGNTQRLLCVCICSCYVLTPSSNMADQSMNGLQQAKKYFRSFSKVVEVRLTGAAGAVHGSLQAGALTSTYTASQGLLLMIPNMYKIAGELLPVYSMFRHVL